jgi:hypothetical protein
VVLAAAAGLVAAGLSTGATTARAEAGFCGLPGFMNAHAFVWTGDAGDGLWATPGNWDVNAAPGQRVNSEGSDVRNQYVCIGRNSDDTKATVTLRGGTFGESAHVEMIDIGDGATLTLTPGAQLYLGRDNAKRSHVRAGSTFNLDGATLGGFGQLLVAGTMHWTSTTQGAATQTTRECDVGVGCVGPLSVSAGDVIVTSGGLLDVDGHPNGGVNLEDGRALFGETGGTIRLENDGFIAADHGTQIVLGGADFVIDNDGGVYEGRDHYGQPLAEVDPRGSEVRKTAAGTSVISGRVIKGGFPTFTVRHGYLSLGTRGVPRAGVHQGASYGDGTCTNPNPPFRCNRPVATAGDPQLAAITLPAHSHPGTLSLAEKPVSNAPSGTMGKAFHTSISYTDASAKHPVSLRFTYDKTLTGNKKPSKLKVFSVHGHDFVKVPDCRHGRPPHGKTSCVAARDRADGGDRFVVVHTTVNSNSRWVVR